MTLYPAGPLERAIALTKLAPKPAPGNLRKMIAIACFSALAGAALLYFYMKNKTKKDEADTQGVKA